VHKTLLVIALSSRPYVEAAKAAGYRITAIDGFADRETYSAAEQVLLVAYDARGFVADALMRIIDTLNCSEYAGFIYGAGFEAQPELLQAIAEKIPLIGNDPETVSRLKSLDFFSTLTKLDIRHPRTFPRPQVQDLTQSKAKKILCKSIGGCGGTHIRVRNPQVNLLNPTEFYYQEFIAGTPVSLLFVGRANRIDIIGFNEQWLSPTTEMPFRYGGAVSNSELPVTLKRQLIQAAERLTKAYGLKGLNSLDAIVHDGLAYILELNPRLSATFDLYADKAINMKRHIEACRGVAAAYEAANQDTTNRAHAIVYAVKKMFISEDFGWPEWVTDKPSLNTAGLCIPQGAPICTVMASGNSSDEAKQLAISRVKMMQELLATFHEKQKKPGQGSLIHKESRAESAFKC
jgi:predicted ATP-grasp superfamily ATP-dependent carboligase